MSGGRPGLFNSPKNVDNFFQELLNPEINSGQVFNHSRTICPKIVAYYLSKRPGQTHLNLFNPEGVILL